MAEQESLSGKIEESVAEGLISRGEAESISAYEALAESRRVSPREIFLYIGGFFVMLAVVFGLQVLWKDLSSLGRVIVVAVPTLILWAAGEALRRRQEPLLRRGAQALWMVAAWLTVTLIALILSEWPGLNVKAEWLLLWASLGALPPTVIPLLIAPGASEGPGAAALALGLAISANKTTELRERAKNWQEAGLVTADQAEAIRAHEGLAERRRVSPRAIIARPLMPDPAQGLAVGTLACLAWIVVFLVIVAVWDTWGLSGMVLCLPFLAIGAVELAGAEAARRREKGGLVGLLYFFGAWSCLWPVSFFSMPSSLPWLVLLLIESVIFIAWAVGRQSRALLFSAAFWLFLVIAMINLDYFKDQLGLPAVLLITGIAFIAIGLGVDRLRRRLAGPEVRR